MGYKKPEAIKRMLEEIEENHSKITELYINTIHDRFVQLMLKYYLESELLQPLPHAEQIFRYLKDNNIKVGLDTGFSHNITAAIMKRLGWIRNKMIDYVISSDEVPAGRPFPYMIQNLMKIAGITDTKSVIKIGDTESDIHEGFNAGCLYSIAMTTGAFTRAQLKPHHPSFIFDHLQELVPIIENHI